MDRLTPAASRRLAPAPARRRGAASVRRRHGAAASRAPSSCRTSSRRCAPRAQALDYRERILGALPEGASFEPLMTLYLTDNTPPEEIARAKLSGRVFGVKLYPAGATTNSHAGVTRLSRCFHALEKMEELGLPLLVHGEVTDPAIDVFDREQAFIEEVLGPRSSASRGLKVVLEHITTREAAQYRRGHRAERRRHHHRAPPAAQPQRALHRRHPAAPLLPAGAQARGAPRGAGRGRDLGQPEVLPRHRQRAARAHTKEAACGCAGIYTAHAAIELYAEAFEEAGALDKLEGFASIRRRTSTACRATAAHDHAGARGLARARARCASATTSWCRCAPAKRFPGSWSSASGLRRACGRGSRGRALARAPQRACRGAGLRTESGKPVRFVPPGAKDAYYEIKVFETGEVETRPDNLHDLFNALAWLAFPRTKARINALHAAEIPREGGRRGRLRDLLTIFDEGGAHRAVRRARAARAAAARCSGRSCSGSSASACARQCASSSSATRCWSRRSSRGRGSPARRSSSLPARIPMPQARDWLGRAAPGASPRDLAPLPVFGYPGWCRAGRRAFYDDTRYFRPPR